MDIDRVVDKLTELRNLLVEAWGRLVNGVTHKADKVKTWGTSPRQHNMFLANARRAKIKLYNLSGCKRQVKKHIPYRRRAY